MGKFSKSGSLGSRRWSTTAQGNRERIKKGRVISITGVGSRGNCHMGVMLGLSLEIQAGIHQIDLIREAVQAEGTA